jgi:hypothetical protein
MEDIRDAHTAGKPVHTYASYGNLISTPNSSIRNLPAEFLAQVQLLGHIKSSPAKNESHLKINQPSTRRQNLRVSY